MTPLSEWETFDIVILVAVLMVIAAAFIFKAILESQDRKNK